MPTYPTPSEYQEAVQFPADAFRDPELQQAHPDENALGLPQPITGNFAAVFPMTNRAGQRWAVKCFLTDVPNQRARYRTIAEHLDAHPLPYTVDFAYQDEGIQVDGTAYPILKMEWVDGVPLNRFVAEHLEAPDRLAQVSAAWATAMAALDEAAIAHGDLQHGNVLVRTDEDDVQLTFVDYDAMVVPGLEQDVIPEVGHRNYQHPDRTEQDVGSSLDRFPALVIFTALRACIAQPGLWARFDTGENLLFRDADFYNPSASVLFEKLNDEASVRPLAEALRKACYVEPEAVPPLAAIRAGTTETNWYAVQPAAARRRQARSRATRTGRERWFLPAALVTALASLGLWIGGWPLAAAGLVGGGVLAGAWSSWQGYRQVSAVRRHRRLDEEEARFDELLHNLERQIESLQAKQQAVQDTVEERRARRLRETREEAIYDRLKHHFIGEAAGVEGVTHKHVVRLKKAGIRTAYEAKPERLEALRTLGDRTAARIAMWRAALIAEHEDALPETLSPAEERRIRRYVERRVSNLDAEIARARAKMRVQHVERERVRARKEEIPALSLGRYMRYLFRLGTLPEQATRPTSAGAAPSEEKQPAAQPRVPAPSAHDDRPWWEPSG